MGRAAASSGADTSAVELARRYVDSSDLDGSWFVLGGSSLDAARLVSALDQELGITLSLRELLCAESVHECLVTAEQSRTSTTPATRPEPTAEPARAGDPVPTAVDLLWPALVSLPADERLKLAHSLLSSVLDGGDPLPQQQVAA